MWLSNSSPPAEPRYAIMRHIIDYYMDLPTEDYSTRDLKVYLDKAKEQEAKRKKDLAERIPEPAAPYGEYVGTYTHTALGEAEITLEDGKLFIALGPEDFPVRKHQMTHINGQQFSFRSGGSGFTLTFSMDDHQLVFDLNLRQNENMGLWRARK
jgi:hypothetical protein